VDCATVATATLPTAFGNLRLYGTPRGLLAVALPGEDRAALERRLGRALGPVAFVEDAAALGPALDQLAAYFAGERRAFDLALDPQGTPFQRAVWAAVAAVPYGETRTYGEIAREIGRPAATRAVGAANGANPLPPIVPCHRLVGADGTLTGYGGGLPMKRALLVLEGARRAEEVEGDRG
jgi:O-6-methylguanine DNA methyltransferase